MAAEPGPDPLTALREQLDRTERAARRLADEAAAAAGRERGTPPPAGWRAAGPDARDAGDLTAAWTSLVEALRTALPAEVQERLLGVLRELLLAVRAVLDLALARLEARRAAPVEVQDIPID
jgi:hypothetical protein